MRIAEINDIASVASALADGLRARGHTVEVIRPRMQNGLQINNGFNGTIRAAIAPNSYRAIATNEGSLQDGVGSMPHVSPPSKLRARYGSSGLLRS